MIPVIPYEVCIEENKVFSGKKKQKQITEKRYNRTQEKLRSRLSEKSYASRSEAEQDLEEHVQQMDPITFFFFKAIIGWLIGRLLDAYFSKSP